MSDRRWNRSREAMELALAAGQQIVICFPNLTLRERLHVVSVFRRQLLPRRKPGRKLSSRITAAHADWNAGISWRFIESTSRMGASQ
jgi:hypothetical protein